MNMEYNSNLRPNLIDGNIRHTINDAIYDPPIYLLKKDDGVTDKLTNGLINIVKTYMCENKYIACVCIFLFIFLCYRYLNKSSKNNENINNSELLKNIILHNKLKLKQEKYQQEQQQKQIELYENLYSDKKHNDNGANQRIEINNDNLFNMGNVNNQLNYDENQKHMMYRMNLLNRNFDKR